MSVPANTEASGPFRTVVLIASIAGKEGNPNAAHYSASKAGLIALTKSLGKELAQHDILVNAVTSVAGGRDWRNWRLPADARKAFVLVGTANAFSLVFRVFGGDEGLGRVLDSLGLGNWGKLLFILTVIFVLGFFIDWLEIVLITLPIFVPVIAKLDFTAHVGDAVLVNVWIGVAVALVLQTSFLTLPFGFALFFLKGSAPPDVTMAHVYRGVVPIVVIQIAVLCIVLAYPWLATELAKMAIR
ncbi:MAG: SDR family NAD(P)-dependent oxidoreductase [Pseudomonadota bacterium]